ncbi:hypothetical protein KIH39_08610 [Telmatocola sphagniphila]|uniref:Uncharacterized protein n=1 Tax=Telmatocola sphagniphila TaxID=1123043 RepID=A0A8E6EZN9_9BACT|nr:hypothetical protein [Telmatocola sphagniphila]QVL33953.1 hypothetical protein KIH39_08610 [Telmatocola sphagniphila]
MPILPMPGLQPLLEVLPTSPSPTPEQPNKSPSTPPPTQSKVSVPKMDVNLDSIILEKILGWVFITTGIALLAGQFIFGWFDFGRPRLGVAFPNPTPKASEGSLVYFVNNNFVLLVVLSFAIGSGLLRNAESRLQHLKRKLSK